MYMYLRIDTHWDHEIKLKQKVKGKTHFVQTATFEGSWMYGQASCLLHFPKINGKIKFSGDIKYVIACVQVQTQGLLSILHLLNM